MMIENILRFEIPEAEQDHKDTPFHSLREML